MDEAESRVVEVREGGYADLMATDGWKLIDFHAGWCPHCRAFRPNYEKAAAAHEGPVRFYAVDVDEANETASHFKIRSLPTIVLMRDEEKMDSHVGVMSAEQVAQWLEERVEG